jgi:hypothetical protein
MDALSKQVEFKDHVYIPYSIESLDDMSYVVFYLEKKKGKDLHFIPHKNFSSKLFKGSISWNQKSFLFYEMIPMEREFLRADEEDLWKVTPYELLYTRSVADISIDSECVDFFKNFPELFTVSKNENEIPIVGYLGIGESELNEQILLQNKNEKKGFLGQGYYFTTYENAEYEALYTEDRDDLIIRLENTSRMNDADFRDDSVYIKDHRFYHYSHELGEVPKCNESVSYLIYYYDKEVIYLKSTRPHGCKKEVKLRKENGFVMRYVLFLKKHLVGKGKDHDSYAYDSTYMIHNSDHFICLSYHSIEKK